MRIQRFERAAGGGRPVLSGWASHPVGSGPLGGYAVAFGEELMVLPLLLALLACGSTTPEVQAADPAATPAATPSATGGAVVAEWDQGKITLGQVDEKVVNQLKTMETEYLLKRWETQSQALEQMVDTQLLEAEVKRLALKDIDALMKIEVEAKAQEPTETDMLAFYGAVQRQLQGMDYESAKPLLKNQLMQQSMGERYQVYLGELRKTHGTKVELPYPELPRVDVAIEDHDPILGAKDAPVTIVQFAEYQCYYCAKASPTLRQLVDSYPGKVKVVFKDFPLGNHQQAMPAAVAAHCADEQGKYWEMNLQLLDHQQALGAADIAGYAKELKLDEKKFEACQGSGRHQPLIENDMELGESLGVSATPTFYVNGILVSGAQPYERFAMLVDRELGIKK